MCLRWNIPIYFHKYIFKFYLLHSLAWTWTSQWVNLFLLYSWHWKQTNEQPKQGGGQNNSLFYFKSYVNVKCVLRFPYNFLVLGHYINPIVILRTIYVLCFCFCFYICIVIKTNYWFYAEGLFLMWLRDHRACQRPNLDRTWTRKSLYWLFSLSCSFILSRQLSQSEVLVFLHRQFLDIWIVIFLLSFGNRG